MILFAQRICFAAVMAICLVFTSLQMWAQPTLDVEKFDWYAKKMQQVGMYVHFDKNVYAPGEEAWFASYVLNPKVSNADFHTISVALIRAADKKICQQQEYAMQFGLANGSIILPDSLLPGAYHLLVYASKLKQQVPECTYVQPISIKPSSAPDMLLLLKNAPQNVSDSIKIQIKLVSKAALPITSQSIVYSSVNAEKAAPIKGTIKTDAKGEATIVIARKMLTKDNSLIKATVKKGFEYTESFCQIPLFNEKIALQMYPEGGSVIDGLPCQIGFETRDAAGAPIAIQGTLYENEQTLLDVSTNTNGLGLLQLVPNKNSRYSLKFKHDTTVYELPNILASGHTLQFKKAAVNDTLELLVQSTQLNTPLSVVFHNYKEVFGKLDFVMKRNSKKIKFPLADLPKGLIAVTLLDSAGKPWAERIAFAHINKRINVQMQQTDKVTTRGKVTMKVLVTDHNNLPQRGIFSVACIQDNRIDPRKHTDIESYFYLVEPLKNMPYAANYLDSAQRQLLEQALLIKGWRRFSWQELQLAEAKDTAQKSSHVQITATIKNLNPEKAKEPYKLQLIKDEGFEVVDANAKGEFVLAPRTLLTAGKQIILTAKNPQNEQIPFTINLPYPKLCEKLNATLPYPMLDFAYANFKKQPIATVDLQESVKMLDEVVVTTTVRCSRTTQRNECGDYVCKTNMLNCPVHLTCGTPAINGTKYYTAIAGRIENLVYRCDGGSKASGVNVQSIKGLTMPKRFYEVNYEVDGKDDQIFQTTMYWNNAIFTNEKGEAEITFNASDLVGKFKCIINGQTATDYFGASKSLLVTGVSKN